LHRVEKSIQGYLFFSDRLFNFAPLGLRSYCNQYVFLSFCLSVCLSARIAQKPRSRTSLSMLPVAVARSSSDGIAISYVLPVLHMTSYFHTMRPMKVIPLLQAFSSVTFRICGFGVDSSSRFPFRVRTHRHTPYAVVGDKAYPPTIAEWVIFDATPSLFFGSRIPCIAGLSRTKRLRLQLLLQLCTLAAVGPIGVEDDLRVQRVTRCFTIRRLQTTTSVRNVLDSIPSTRRRRCHHRISPFDRLVDGFPTRGGNFGVSSGVRKLADWNCRFS